MSTFTAEFNVTGARRKELVTRISEAMECPAKYQGAPSFAYMVDYITIDRNGTVSFDDRADSEEIEHLFDYLDEHGFGAERKETGAAEEEPSGLTIRVPKDKVGVKNLCLILLGKGALIKKALGLNDLPLKEDGDEITFPWFSDAGKLDPDEVKAYTDFIGKLCEFSANAKRVSMKEKTVDNEKYAFRCFLLRLGFIGADYKTDRKILLRNLDGSSAFRDGGADDENAE